MRTSIPLAAAAVTTVVSLIGFFGLPEAGLAQIGNVPPTPVPADSSLDDPTEPARADGGANLRGAEVLTRGPVHEAFASPTPLDPQATPTIKRKPPDSIEEVPPDEQPDGDHVVWIPGYWSWDDERNDFIWVSGLYRNAPPNQTWVPGCWNEVSDGYQWTPGFWTSAKQDAVTYLDTAPPASLESGPSSPSPSDDHFWIPGCWIYQDIRYVWRPGYWSAAQPNWVWVPAHYQWSLGGYIFVPGYWDFLPVSRGFLFAPVYFTQPIYYQPAFVFRPAVVIDSGFFSANLFCRPSFCNYYFGDYFGVQYSNVGFRPWFSVAVGIGGRPCYDPFFTYYNCHNRHHDRDWLVHAQRRYDQLRHDEHLRPPHTFVAAHNDTRRAGRANQGSHEAIAKALSDVKRDGGTGDVKARTVNLADRGKFIKQAAELRDFAKHRKEVEKKFDLSQTDRNADRHRASNAGAVAKSPDRNMRLPALAKIDSPALDRNKLAGDKLGHSTDAARKVGSHDRPTPATGPRRDDELRLKVGGSNA
ncbi:MAG: YXWGXW repeat-containing protein [Pirellulales bacterium]|nr:YXWGXW repeat-containing protein [Pirellulales bacterium]